ncbi:alginate lyase family protein [Marinibaculum pumilum]|uniref:Alginate lyase family protein n=1 Tax=Marinibaculum pumilum TaxID=1766165 RepID=A0ABV7L8S8_9PROT
MAAPDPARPPDRATPATGASGLAERLFWYLHRLRAMSLQEVAHRLREQQRRHLSRRLRPAPARWLLPEAEDRLPDHPPLRRGLVALAAAAPVADRLAQAAEAVARGEIEVYGRRWHCREGALPDWPLPDWHWDPGSGTRWPADRYCFDIPFRHVRLDDAESAAGRGPGEARFVWELNRLAYLQPVAAHACLSGDPAARQLCLRHLEDWLDANPPFLGINWASGIELGTRVISLVVILSFLEAGTLPQALRRRLAESLAAHGYWLHRFPSRFSSANNHVIAEVAGLFLLGSLFGGLRDAAAWEREGRRGLEREAGLQILDDGAGAEQSPAYAALNLEMFGICAQVAADLGRPFDAAFLDRLARGAEWLQGIGDRDGHVPDLGDADGASMFAREGPQDRYPAAIRGCIAQLVGRPGIAPPRPEPALRHALFGLPPPGMPGPDGMRTFAAGGMTVLRWDPAGAADGREALLVFDHGPLGYLSIAAHGHADALSVWLHLDGRPVLVDAGTWMYLGAGSWRSHFRGTAAHNTLCIDGASSSAMSGPFNWRSRAVTALLESGEDDDGWYAVAEHDGYAADFGVRHRRHLHRQGDRRIVIEDMLVAAGGDTAAQAAAAALPVEIGFQFAPDLELAERSDGWQVMRGGAAVLHLSGAAGMTCCLAAGRTDPPAGWVSTAFGERQAAPRLEYRGRLRPGESCRITLTIE